MSDKVSRKAKEYKLQIQSQNWTQDDYKETITTLLPCLVQDTTEACLSNLCLHMMSSRNLSANDVDHIKSEKVAYEINTKFYSAISTKPIEEALPFLLSALEENAAGKLAEKILSRLRGSDNFIIENWNYKTIEVLGSGSFGVVISATHTIDEQIYALKIVPNRNVALRDKNDILRELRNQAKLDHRNVVKYKSSDEFSLSVNKIKEILQWEYTDKILEYTRANFALCFELAKNGPVRGFIIKMELCGESLREWLNKILNENNQPKMSMCELISQAIADGLCYIHQKKLIHRDLRPDNIYFSKSDFVPPVKIGDFGLSITSTQYEVQTMSIAVGNPYYRAPEMEEEHKDGKAKYGQYVDWFSFGLILSEIFDPAKESNLKNKLGQIRYARNTGNTIRKVSWLNSLILQLTEEEPNERIELKHLANIMPIRFNFISVESQVELDATERLDLIQENNKEIQQTRKTLEDSLNSAVLSYSQELANIEKTVKRKEDLSNFIGKAEAKIRNEFITVFKNEPYHILQELSEMLNSALKEQSSIAIKKFDKQQQKEMKDSNDLGRFLSDYKDLTGRITSIMSLVHSDELASDVNGAEVMVKRNQKHRTELDAHSGAFQAFELFGKQLLESRHYANVQIEEKLKSMTDERQKLEQEWSARSRQLNQCLELQLFYRDCQEADSWMDSRERFLPEDKKSLDEKSPIKKLEDFDEDIAKQEEKMSQLTKFAHRLTSSNHYASDSIETKKIQLLKRWGKFKNAFTEKKSKLQARQQFPRNADQVDNFQPKLTQLAPEEPHKLRKEFPKAKPAISQQRHLEKLIEEKRFEESVHLARFIDGELKTQTSKFNLAICQEKNDQLEESSNILKELEKEEMKETREYSKDAVEMGMLELKEELSRDLIWGHLLIIYWKLGNKENIKELLESRKRFQVITSTDSLGTLIRLVHSDLIKSNYSLVKDDDATTIELELGGESTKIKLKRCSLDLSSFDRLSPEELQLGWFVSFNRNGREVVEANLNKFCDFHKINKSTLMGGWGRKMSIELSDEISMEYLELIGVKVLNWKEARWHIQRLELLSIPLVEKTKMKVKEMDFLHSSLDISCLPPTIEKLYLREAKVVCNEPIDLPNLKYLTLFGMSDSSFLSSFRSANLTHIHFNMMKEVNVDQIPKSVTHIKIRNGYTIVVGGVRRVEKLILVEFSLKQVEELLGHFQTDELVLFSSFTPKELIELTKIEIKRIAVGKIFWGKEDLSVFSSHVDRKADYYLWEGGRGRGMEEIEFGELRKLY